MTFEQHYTNLITDLESKFPKLVKKYDLSVSHSGGGCFHIEMRLDKKRSVLINPYSDDVEYDIPKNAKSKCILEFIMKIMKNMKHFLHHLKMV